MNYTLKTTAKEGEKTGGVFSAVRRLAPLMVEEKGNIALTLVCVILTTAATLISPVIIARAVDTYIQSKDFGGVLMLAALLLCIYIANMIANYFQTRTMGGVGRRVLFNLRNVLFLKLQELPVAFFNQNKAGDLISRINNDTDKLSQFFAQALIQFVSNLFLIVGTGIFLLVLNYRLGLAALLPAFVALIIMQLLSGFVQRRNLESLRTQGSMSAEVQESIANFKVIVAFNRLDYFRTKFRGSNDANYTASVQAGIANNLFMPLYGLAYNLAQLIVMGYGVILIVGGQLTVGLLVGFLLYVTNFYNPLRQLAAIWSSLQLSLAALDRISEVLALRSDMESVPAVPAASSALLEFRGVRFHYPDGKEVLHNIDFALERGKTYALVGPTGGGKTTTASLMARLYDASEGEIFLDGRDIRSWSAQERAQKIGFILQEPFLFTGTVRDNLVYGNDMYRNATSEELRAVLEEKNLSDLLARFEKGLDTPTAATGDTISLGQKQLIAFMRAVLREPELLILDEATANIDTVTEQLLEEILSKLPETTTKVIIAHRLNTIDSADEIFFVNGGEVVPAGSMEHAVEMLLHGKRQS